MADFCKQCSINLFGEDFKELAGLGKPGTKLNAGEGFPALCEGCGPTIVDHDGKCLSWDCLKHHGKMDMEKIKNHPTDDPSVKDVHSIGEQVAEGLYKLREFNEDWDFYDPKIERWIWSVGKHKATGETYAATDARFYSNDDYDCLWLR